MHIIRNKVKGVLFIKVEDMKTPSPNQFFPLYRNKAQGRTDSGIDIKGMNEQEKRRDRKEGTTEISK